MKDQVSRIEYFAITIDDRPGAGADFGKKLAKEGVNLLALLAFPTEPGKAQVDLVPENPEALLKAARKHGITLGEPKTAFMVQGTDRPGALAEIIERLGSQGINVRASFATCAGGNRYGGVIWVEPAKVDQATRALGATPMAHHV